MAGSQLEAALLALHTQSDTASLQACEQCIRASLSAPGGLAALLHATAYVVGIILGLTVMFPLLEAAPDQYLKFLSENQALVYGWNFIGYWGSAITPVILVLARYYHGSCSTPRTTGPEASRLDDRWGKGK